MTESTLTFEQQLERLDAIVRQLERGDAPLDRSLALFEEGTALIRSCGALLDAETIELPDELLAHVQQDTGCEIRRYQISFTGVCPNCLQKH